MKNEIDAIGEPKAVWVFCGPFPLDEIQKGRRACRSGWRVAGEDSPYGDMLAVISAKNPGDSDNACFLCLERENEEYIDVAMEIFSDIKDMQANDWFLEQEEADPLCTCPKECDCQNPPPDDWNGENGVYHVSNECPIHNDNPQPRADCPVHVKNLPVETPP